MRFRVLGPLEAYDDSGGPVLPRSGRQRALLALLLCRANLRIATDLLVEELWQGDPPASARANIQVYVHRLRGVLGESRIVYTAQGYSVVVGTGELDAAEFEQQAGGGRRALERGDHEGAVRLFEEALGYWRGPAYGGLDDHAVVQEEAARLDELRAATTEDWIEAGLALGRHGELIAELTTQVAQHPLRERLAGQLMLALYRSGRSAEALETYRRVRARLVDEIGVEPGADLRQLHQAILTEDPALELSRVIRPVVIPAELPGIPSTFTGRRAELDRLTGRLRVPDIRTDGAPVVAAIDGAGGIGKSTLAIRAARLVAEQFPGGQLYVNLGGAAAGGLAPLTPAEALGRLLRSLGVGDQEIPVEVEEAAARFRSLTADRRVLVVLDDAAHPGQVRRLLPGAGSAVLVTSRQVLAALDVTEYVHLDALAEDEAITLLGQLAGVHRVARERAHAEEIVRFCGHLPLGVRITGARLAARPEWSLATLADRLADEHTRLDELEHADLAVRVSCAVSYHALPDAAARLFDLLGTLELADLTAPVAAALADLPVHEVQRQLDHLVDAQLVRLRGDRYSLHDLLCLYAREQAAEHLDEADRNAAIERVLHHYLATARAATRLTSADAQWRLSTGLPESETRVVGLDLQDAAVAARWATTESLNIVAVARHAGATTVDPGVLAGLAAALFDPLESSGRWAELISVNRVALAAAERFRHRSWRATAHHDLGTSYVRLGRLSEAERHLPDALDAFRKDRNDHGAAHVLNSLGQLADRQGRSFDEASSYFQEALTTFRRLGYGLGEATMLNNLGVLHAHAGRPAEAAPFFEQSVATYAEIDNPRGRAIALGNLGESHGDAGRPEAAIAYLESALEECRRSGYRHLEAATRWKLGEVLHGMGRVQQARESWAESLQQLSDMGTMSAAEAESILAEPEPERPATLLRP